MRGKTIKTKKTTTEDISGSGLRTATSTTAVSDKQITLKHLTVIWLQQIIIIAVATIVVSWIKSKADYSVLVGGEQRFQIVKHLLYYGPEFVYS